jgi:hypothetical protein
MLNWNSTIEDTRTISAIADRYIKFCQELTGVTPAKFKLIMDIEATNNNGCPLKLDELLNANGMDFIHDVTGIQSNINRETGKLENCFLPRYAK